MRKIILGITLAALLFTGYSPIPVAQITPQTAHAQFMGLISGAQAPAPTGADDTPGLFDCLKNPIMCSVFYIGYGAAVVSGFFIGIGAWLVNAALIMNDLVVKSLGVKLGFELTLALANMVFVLGIIVVAISTILRIESYGIKQILFRLIVMTILVNFSMVFATVLLNVAHNLTLYFLAPFHATSDLGSFQAFVDHLVGAFKPQGLYSLPAEQGQTSAQYLAQFVKNDADRVFQLFFNMLFIGIFGFVVSFILFALAAMLLVRFGMIAMLLILMPIAWASWVFPPFKSNFDKWLNKFLRWTFFAPIVVMFLYLAIYVVQIGDPVYNATSRYFQSSPTGSSGQISNTVQSGLAAVTGNPTLLDNVSKMIVVIALAVGGLFAANALSITGASHAMGALKGAGKAAGTGMRKRAATFAARGGRNVTGKLSRFGMEASNPVSKAGGFYQVRKFANALRPRSILAGVKSQEGIAVEEASKDLKKAETAVVASKVKIPKLENEAAEKKKIVTELEAQKPPPGGNVAHLQRITLAKDSARVAEEALAKEQALVRAAEASFRQAQDKAKEVGRATEGKKLMEKEATIPLVGRPTLEYATERMNNFVEEAEKSPGLLSEIVEGGKKGFGAGGKQKKLHATKAQIDAMFDVHGDHPPSATPPPAGGPAPAHH